MWTQTEMMITQALCSPTSPVDAFMLSCGNRWDNNAESWWKLLLASLMIGENWLSKPLILVFQSKVRLYMCQLNLHTPFILRFLPVNMSRCHRPTGRKSHSKLLARRESPSNWSTPPQDQGNIYVMPSGTPETPETRHGWLITYPLYLFLFCLLYYIWHKMPFSNK